jgi:hypothetical protein
LETTVTRIFDFDAYSPSQVADRVQGVCLIKARLPLSMTWMLAVLAGACVRCGRL